jgi:hypothetical protein
VWGLVWGRYKGSTVAIPFSVSSAEVFSESCWGGLWRLGVAVVVGVWLRGV